MKHLFLLAVLPVVLMGWSSCTHSGKGHTARFIAASRGMELDELARATTQNAETFYNMDKG